MIYTETSIYVIENETNDFLFKQFTLNLFFS